MATNHREYFTDGKEVRFVDQDVRVESDGVFLLNQRVADFGLIVERVDRTAVDTGTSSLSVKRMSAGAKVAIGVAVGVSMFLLIGFAVLHSVD
jgi:hypothetical protein